jgi:hypothetical protein
MSKYHASRLSERLIHKEAAEGSLHALCSHLQFQTLHEVSSEYSSDYL